MTGHAVSWEGQSDLGCTILDFLALAFCEAVDLRQTPLERT